MPNFSTIYGAGTSFRTNQGTRHVPPHMDYPHSLPSCPIPEAFNGYGDFEDYLHQFNTCAQLSGWYLSGGDDLRHQYFAMRLKGNALDFFSTLNYDQQNSYDELVEAFRQNYTTN